MTIKVSRVSSDASHFVSRQSHPNGDDWSRRRPSVSNRLYDLTDAAIKMKSKVKG